MSSGTRNSQHRPREQVDEDAKGTASSLGRSEFSNCLLGSELLWSDGHFLSTLLVSLPVFSPLLLQATHLANSNAPHRSADITLLPRSRSLMYNFCKWMTRSRTHSLKEMENKSKGSRSLRQNHVFYFFPLKTPHFFPSNVFNFFSQQVLALLLSEGILRIRLTQP